MLDPAAYSQARTSFNSAMVVCFSKRSFEYFRDDTHFFSHASSIARTCAFQSPNEASESTKCGATLSAR